MTIKNNKSTYFIIRLFLLYSILCLVIVYTFLFCNHELTTSGRLLRFISKNDYFLTFFYIGLYAGFIFLYLYFFGFLSVPVSA
ncbi:hypothetical protein BTJ39_20675 [Izhakiella australiensis]|uniref:Uncharacterized protein n=1 Tax=Izhakiella australiensis TaxID=1926881 RepID=A0A1S8YDF3_9GAMM|nr:hypothetical protein BTJ39_20675 [Izhakiella australiensis]